MLEYHTRAKEGLEEVIVVLMTDKRIIYSSGSAHNRLPSSVLGLQLAACPPWINVVYLVYSLITHVYFKSTTFLQGATVQAGMLHDTVCGAFFQRYSIQQRSADNPS